MHLPIVAVAGLFDMPALFRKARLDATSSAKPSERLNHPTAGSSYGTESQCNEDGISVEAFVSTKAKRCGSGSTRNMCSTPMDWKSAFVIGSFSAR